MATNTEYIIEYAKTARANCKLKSCKGTINKGELRVGKKFPSSRFTADGMAINWFHLGCMFETLTRARKQTKKIESPSDLNGFDALTSDDKKLVKDHIKKLKSGELSDKSKSKKVKKKEKEKDVTTPSSPTPAVDEEKFKVSIIREEDNSEFPLESGDNYLGRNELITKDKRVSKFHVKIIVDTVKHKVDITGESTNPAYIKRKDDSVATLNKGDTLSIENGESVNLLKGNFGFKMKIVETNSHESDSDLEDAPDPYVEEEEEKKPTTKRKNDDEDEERETKKTKIDTTLTLPKCPFGAACYRKNPTHFQDYSHDA